MFTEVLNFIKTRKRIFLPIFVSLLLIGLALPFFAAHAAFSLSDLGSMLNPLNWLKKIPEVIFGMIFQIILAIANVFVSLMAVILGWVTNSTFISLSYTKVAGEGANPILAIGWNLTRDLANMFMVLILVAMGLGTALRFKNYEIKKLLPVFIGVVLLINFSPVICGVVVDASNIVMNFFLEDVTGWDTFANFFSVQAQNFGKIVTGWPPSWGPVAEAATMALFSFVAGFVLLIYILIFLARYVVIWVLVILSPLAFLAYILPSTRDIAAKWWKQLIQWSFVGAIAGFFLYLGFQILYFASKSEIFDANLQSTNPQIGAGLFNNILPYSAVIIFLFIGLIMGFNGSATGAKAIVDWGKKQGSAGLTKGWQKAKPWLRENTLSKGTKEKLQKMASSSKPGDKMSGLKGKVVRGLGAPLWAVTRGIGKAVEPAISEGEEKDFSDAKEGVLKKDVQRMVTAYRSAIADSQKAGILSAIVEKGVTSDAIKKGLAPAEVKRLLTKLTKKGQDKKAVQVARGFLKDFKPEDVGLEMSNEDKEKYKGGYTEKLIAEARKEEDIKALGKDFAEKIPEAIDAIDKFWTGDQMKIAAKNFGGSFTNAYNEKRKELGRDVSYDAATNPFLHRYKGTTAAQEAGIGYPEMTKAEKEIKMATTRKLEKEIGEKSEEKGQESIKLEKTKKELESLKAKEEKNKKEQAQETNLEKEVKKINDNLGNIEKAVSGREKEITLRKEIKTSSERTVEAIERKGGLRPLGSAIKGESPRAPRGSKDIGIDKKTPRGRMGA